MGEEYKAPKSFSAPRISRHEVEEQIYQRKAGVNSCHKMQYEWLFISEKNAHF